MKRNEQQLAPTKQTVLQKFSVEIDGLLQINGLLAL